ncbi:MAG TPA: ABC transporter permease [Gemmatimonadaceae bacterium]|nr:ABC transporter permease [Gemmatimonadaceae bacterium]
MRQWLHRIARQLRALVRGGALDQDVEAEMRLHVEMETDDLIRAYGLSPVEARRRALVAFGGVERYKEAHRDARGVRWVEELGTDFRYAVRSLVHAPVFSLSTLLILTLGIGATTATYSVVSTVLLRPLPFAHPDRIVMIWSHVPQINAGFAEQPIGGAQFDLIRSHNRAFSSVTAMRPRYFNLGAAATAARIDGTQVTSEFFETIGVRPELGRTFRPEEELPGADHVVVLSDALWRARFHADPRIVGRTITLDGQPFTVIGVAPRGFDFPTGAAMPADFQFPERAELWVPKRPLRTGPSELAVMGRLRSGVPVPSAQKDLDRLARVLESQNPAWKGWADTRAVPLRRQMVGDVTPMLLALLGAVALLLAIACVNASQLLLARVQGRGTELAVRAALGGSPGRIARALLIEAIVLTVTAGACGTALAYGGILAVRRFGPTHLPRLAEVGFDARIALAAMVVTLAAGIVFGLVPAVVGGRASLAQLIRRAGRGAGRGMPVRTRRAMIAGEIALSVVLVAGSGLLIRSLLRELQSDTGFTPAHAITFEVTLPKSSYPEHQPGMYMVHPRAVQFISQALERLRAIPGVAAAGVGKPLPLSGAQEWSVMWPENSLTFATVDPKHPAGADYTIASPGMFAALGTTLIAGRDFSASDQEHTLPVVIVNESLARWLWPGESALGKRLKLGGSPASSAPWMTVVGVARNLRRYSLTKGPQPEMIVPYTQDPYPSFSTMQFIVRATGDPTRLVSAIRGAIVQTDPAIPIAKVRTMEELIGESSATARFATGFMTAFGAAALALAVIGLYGVIAYTVHQRRQEIGVRRALGATHASVVRLIVREGVRLAGIGIVAGLLMSALALRALHSLLYQVSVFDPLTLLLVVTVLAGGVAVACVVPALRAASIEPRVALDEG